MMRNLFFILLFSTLLIACKKHRIERKYTGDYLFTVHSVSWQMNRGTTDTTYTYPGRIELSDETYNGLSEKDIYVKIYFAYNGIYGNTAIDKDGNFSFPGCSGGFTSKDELDCVFTEQSLSSSYSYTVHGVKR